MNKGGEKIRKIITKKILIPTLLILLFLIISTASAATHNIDNSTNLNDFITDNAANNDIINLDTGIYDYSHINNTEGININKNLTIIGKGADKTIIDAQEQGRIFSLTSGNTLTLINITLNNGNIYGNGGAIYSEGTLKITNCTFTNNIAAIGGAIWNSGDNMNVNDSTFTNNYGYFYGGAISNSGDNINVNNSTFTNNYGYFYGGAISNSGDNMNVNDSIFTNNTSNIGGAIRNNYCNGMIITSCDFINNTNTMSNLDATCVINYNRFLNNTGYDINNEGSSVIDVDFNWWGSNNPDISKIIGAIINNYYVMNIALIGSNWSVGDNLLVSYNFVLNGTNDTVGAELLPYFNTVFYLNSIEINVIDARISQIIQILLKSANPNTNITAVTDNQIETLLINVNKGETILTVENITTETNKTINLTAKLADKNGNPLIGKTINFFINGKYIGNATTNNEGIAVLSYTPINTGDYTITASFDGDNDYLNSTNDSSLTVTTQPTPTPKPTPNPVPNNDTNNTNNNPVASATMKKTGLTINLVLIVLLSLIELVYYRKK